MELSVRIINNMSIYLNFFSIIQYSKLGVFTLLVYLANSFGVSDTLTDTTITIANFHNRKISLSGTCEITITDSINPLQGSTLNCLSNTIWLYFPNIKPLTFNTKYRNVLQVNGIAAMTDQNIRIEQYLRGTMVISHPSSYKPLRVYSGENTT